MCICRTLWRRRVEKGSTRPCTSSCPGSWSRADPPSRPSGATWAKTTTWTATPSCRHCSLTCNQVGDVQVLWWSINICFLSYKMENLKIQTWEIRVRFLSQVKLVMRKCYISDSRLLRYRFQSAMSSGFSPCQNKMLQFPGVRRNPLEVTKLLTWRKGATRTGRPTLTVSTHSIRPRQVTNQVISHDTPVVTALFQ